MNTTTTTPPDCYPILGVGKYPDRPSLNQRIILLDTPFPEYPMIKMGEVSNEELGKILSIALGTQLTKKQKKVFVRQVGAAHNGRGYTKRQQFGTYTIDPKKLCKVEIRYDDECGNGHNSFAITGECDESFGCIHDVIEYVFPELAPFIKWHLSSSDGPMYYLGNTIYHAGDRDHWGLRKDEFRQSLDRQTGKPIWRLKGAEKSLKEVSAEEKPPAILVEYEPYGITGEGKKRELEYARGSAVWPEATDEQLMLEKPELTKLLMERFPRLLLEFKHAVQQLGFTY